MKFSTSPISKFQFSIARNAGKSASARRGQIGNWQSAIENGAAAFTLIEIAICLAIIGFALIAIIGVLPIGLHTQRDNREETIINQDATMLLETIRSGARGADDLTNYVYAITNSWQKFDNQGNPVGSPGVNGYTYGSVSIASPVYPNAPYSSAPITNGANIIGLLSTPQFIADSRNLPGTNYPAVPNLFYAAARYSSGCYSNHVVAYIRSISGLAAEKPPQDNGIMVADTLSYRLYCVNAAMPMDTNIFSQPPAQQRNMEQIAVQMHELRLTFRWPILPNGKIADNGSSPQTFRTSIAGELALFNSFSQAQPLYFYQPQSFIPAP